MSRSLVGVATRRLISASAPDEADEVAGQLAEHVAERIAIRRAAARELAVRGAAHLDVVVDVDQPTFQAVAPEARDVQRGVADAAQVPAPFARRRARRGQHAERERRALDLLDGVAGKQLDHVVLDHHPRGKPLVPEGSLDLILEKGFDRAAEIHDPPMNTSRRKVKDSLMITNGYMRETWQPTGPRCQRGRANH